MPGISYFTLGEFQRPLLSLEAREKLTLEVVVINDQGFLEFTEHDALGNI